MLSFRYIFPIVAAALAASPASAQDIGVPSPLEALYGCQAVAAASEKLSCFERETAALQALETGRELTVIDAPTAVAIKEESFGFSMPSLPALNLPTLGENEEDEIDEVRLPVKRVRKVGRDYVVEMDNGQVWRQVGGRLNYVPRERDAPLEAIITSAAIGSFKMKISNGRETVRGLRVRRVQ